MARPEQAEEVVAKIRDEGGTAYAYKPARGARRERARRLTTIYRGSLHFTRSGARDVAHSSPPIRSPPATTLKDERALQKTDRSAPPIE